MKNPPQKIMVIVGLGLFLAFNAIGIAMALTMKDSMKVFSLLLFFAISLYVGGLFFVFNRVVRPRAVTIEDPLIIHYLARSPKILPLEDIEWVGLAPEVGRAERIGGLKVKCLKHPVPLTPGIVHEIQEEYARRYGHYPPPRPMNFGRNPPIVRDGR
jgi:hypothetical protein